MFHVKHSTSIFNIKENNMAKNALGRGLSSLIPEATTGIIENDLEISNGFKGSVIKLSDLSLGRFQPREYFDETKINELATSIEKNGILQPILVRPLAEAGKYQIIAGERRWRASKQLNLETIPAVVRDLSDKDALEIALVENIQRQSLTPIEEAEGYKRLTEEFSYTQEQLAKGLGKSRSHISNMQRLLGLPSEIKDLINSGSLSMGHARTLVKAENPIELAHKIIKEGLSVRESEKFAAGYSNNTPKKSTKKVKFTASNSPQNKDEDLVALENSISDSLGLRVSVEDSDEGGKVSVFFNSLSELDIILQKLS